MIRKPHQDPSKNLVGFVVGDVRYAVPIGEVREIVNPLPVVELPGASGAVIGVADYRDDVVPVVDLRRRFGLETTPQTRRTKWIVMGVGERVVALVVDAVTDVFRSYDALRPAPAIGVGTDRRAIAGVTTRQGDLVFVLDTTRFEDVAELEAQP